MEKSELKFEVEMDEHHVPETIRWEAMDGAEKSLCDAVIVSIWDKKEQNTLKIDLWTKDMLVDDMKKFYHQTLLTMADTFEKATGDQEMAKSMREYSRYFGEELGLIDKK